MEFLIKVSVLAVAIFLVAQLLPKVHLKSFGTAVLVSIIYSLINFFFGWLLILISLPFLIITFGLFKFVINAFLLWITDKIIHDFRIETFGITLIAAFLITIVDSLLRWTILM